MWSHIDRLFSVRATRRLWRARWLLVSDIDGTLIDGENPRLAELTAWLMAHRDQVAFGLASGRHLPFTLEAVEEHRLPPPDVVICLVGTEIYYGAELVPDRRWRRRLSERWDRDAIVRFLQGEEGLRPQAEEFQSPHKVSYTVGPDFGEADLVALRRRLRECGLHARVIHCHGRYLDILPYRAGKGRAIHHLALRWELPLERIVTCGNSGNDADMLKGTMRGVVVGNHSPELEAFRGQESIYFAQAPVAAGILEGLRHYGVLAELA